MVGGRITDYFTKWAEAEALPSKEAKGVAEFLYNVCFRLVLCFIYIKVYLHIIIVIISHYHITRGEL